jgi:hypothetical protein
MSTVAHALRPPAGEDGVPASTSDAGRAVAAAAAQIELAMMEAELPVRRFGDAVAAMLEGFCALRDALEARSAQQPHAADPGEIAAGLQSQLASAVEHAQCFDRMFQHLAHLRDFLDSVAGKIDEERVTSGGDGGWETLCSALRARLLTPEQRALLDRAVNGGPATDDTGADARGSVELF